MPVSISGFNPGGVLMLAGRLYTGDDTVVLAYIRYKS